MERAVAIAVRDHVAMKAAEAAATKAAREAEERARKPKLDINERRAVRRSLGWCVNHDAPATRGCRCEACYWVHRLGREKAVAKGKIPESVVAALSDQPDQNI